MKSQFHENENKKITQFNEISWICDIVLCLYLNQWPGKEWTHVTELELEWPHRSGGRGGGGGEFCH